MFLYTKGAIEYGFTLKDQTLHIRIGEREYSEAEFHFTSPQLDEGDIHALDYLLRQLKEQIPESEIKVKAGTAYIKLIHFFINEHYLSPEKKLDRHNRITSKNILPAYEEYLHYPMVDVLIRCFHRQMHLEIETIRNINFTCDFDILNPWRMRGKLFGIPRLLNALFRGQFSKFLNELPAVFLSDRALRYSYYMNDKMFYEPKDILQAGPDFNIQNIAFWLFLQGNNEYDFENNYEQRSFRRFQNRLNYYNVRHGLHPNYNTIAKRSINKQKRKFFAVFRRQPVLARFHYFRLKYPEDLWQLDDNAIHADYSYCFPDSLHFRGGRSCAIYLWSAERRIPIPVLSIPITASDTVVSEYLNYNSVEAYDRVSEKLQKAFNYGFSITLLWHNSNTYRYGGPRDNYHPQLIHKLKRFVKQLISNRDMAEED